MADKYINPFTDFGFKKIFGQEENKDLLIDFIQTLLPEKGNIINIKYLKTEKLGRAISERRAIYDLYCENDLGEKFIVELQRAQQDYFKERSIYYATFAIQEQAKKGKWDYNWQGVYTIAIMDFSFPNSPHKNVKTQAVLYDEENKIIFSDKLKFVYLEMDKFTKSIDELENYYEKWLYLLKNLAFLDKIPTKLREKAFQKVFQIAEIAKYNPKERQKYEDSLKHYRDIENSLDLKFEEGRGIGKEEGIQEGIVKGKEEGSQERAFTIAQNMKLKGFSVQDIIEVTALTESEIKQI